MFITFEGIDFCGKSTQVDLLKDHLIKSGEKVKLIREPGGTSISEKIRDVLLDKKNLQMFFETEILLFSASRAQLVREVIIPHLQGGYFVISDRFHDSTVAYQGFGRGLPLEFVNELNKFAIGTTVPEITFFIDIPIEESHKRKKFRNGGNLDRIEISNDDFYLKVRNGYLDLSEKEHRVKVIDGMQKIEVIHEQILNEIASKRKKG